MNDSDKVSDCAHDDEAETDSLAELDEFPLVGYVMVSFRGCAHEMATATAVYTYASGICS